LGLQGRRHFSGWWFGDELGGSQVWANAASHGQTPPRSGWCVPWDAHKAEEGVLIVEMTTATTSSPGGTPAGKGGAQAGKGGVQAGKGDTQAAKPAANALANTQRFKKCSDSVTATENAANAATGAAKKIAENKNATEGMLKGAMDSLTKQQTALTEVSKSLAQEMVEARKGGASSSALVADVTKLQTKVKASQAAVNSELFKIKGLHTKAANEQKKREAEKKVKEQE